LIRGRDLVEEQACYQPVRLLGNSRDVADVTLASTKLKDYDIDA